MSVADSSPNQDGNTSERRPAHSLSAPDITVNARDVFKIDVDMEIPAFSTPSEYVPDLDETYVFDRDTTWRFWPDLPITAVS